MLSLPVPASVWQPPTLRSQALCADLQQIASSKQASFREQGSFQLSSKVVLTQDPFFPEAFALCCVINRFNCLS